MSNFDVLKAAIFGMAIGDALGVPFEFEKRGTFTATGYHLDENHGGVPQWSLWRGRIPFGAWSDDTSMTLSMMDAIIESDGKIDKRLMMEKFTDWWYRRANCAIDKPFGLGGCIRKAMNRFIIGRDIDKCGCNKEKENGNGSLMHILPIAFTNFTDNEIREASAVTHAHILSTEACVVYISIARQLLLGYDIKTAISYAERRTCVDEYKNLIYSISIPAEEVVSTGFVVDTLKTSLWCIANTNSYKSAVLQAVNFGYDTDTVACITGGLAGIIYGINENNGIPQTWIDATLKMDLIEEKCKSFAEIIK